MQRVKKTKQFTNQTLFGSTHRLTQKTKIHNFLS